jgi:nicotinamide riboside transporter PnuC
MVIISWITTAICLLGTVLNVKKINLCFWLWLAGNILWLIIDICNGLWSRAILDTVQGILALWGIIEWKKEDKK